jgi:hypothetical protein
MTPLYPDEDALRAAIAPHLTRAAFARALTELEAYGFPKVHPLFKGRYLPAVRAWLDAQAGLSKTGPQVEDGEETWGGGQEQGAGPDRPEEKERPRSSVLERRQRLAEGEGLSRALDPFTERRHRTGNHRPL